MSKYFNFEDEKHDLRSSTSSIVDIPRFSIFSESAFSRFESSFHLSLSNLDEPIEPSYSDSFGNFHRYHMSWAGPQTQQFIDQSSPVCKSDYSSLPQTSAVMFLASFAECDSSSSSNRPTEIYEGMEIGDYIVGRIIGSGAYSQCRMGFKKDSESQRVAMKIVRHEGMHDTIEHEIEIWSRLDHPGFLPLLDAIKFHDLTVVVSPLAERGSLLKHLQNSGPFNPAQAKPIFKILCEALKHLHNEHRIVHHDIKLENILLDKAMKPFLCDFGLSEYIDQKSLCYHENTSQEDLLMKGSLWYLPPEIIDCTRSRRCSLRGDEAFNFSGDIRLEKTKVDVWAMGVVLYAMMSGSLPFTDDYLPRLQMSITNGDYPALDDADEHLCDLISKLLAVDPDTRPLISDVLSHNWFQQSK